MKGAEKELPAAYEKVIHLKNLKKTFKNSSIPAVNDISFAVDSGSFTCIIGTSGCGKTTTLKIINRLIEPTSGTIEVNGIKSHEMPAVEWRRKIGYVIQKIGLLPHLTVKENISLLPSVLKKKKKTIRERTDYLLQLVGLEPKKHRDRYPLELSGGQQQRVGIARALMEDPPILLMDEPFGALDAITRSSLKQNLMSLNQKLKKTILLVTHDLNEAFEMGDKIILMRKGRIVQSGSKFELKNKPANQFVRDFLNNEKI